MTKSYDEATHTYKIGEKKIPHLTGILSDAGLIGGVQFMSEHARWRGSVIHKSIHFLNKGTLDWSSIEMDEVITGSVKAYEDYKNKHIKEVLYSEHWMVDDILQFGGKPDVICKFEDGTVGPLEVKSGAIAKWTRLQLAGQAYLLKHEMKLASPYTIPRRALQVRPDGTWLEDRYTNPRDIDIFLAAYSIANWKKQ